MHAIVLTIVAFSISMIGGTALAQDKEFVKSSNIHLWSEIAYPHLDFEGHAGLKTIPAIRPREDGKGLVFELTITGKITDFVEQFESGFETRCTAVLHSADGRSRSSIDGCEMAQVLDRESELGTMTISCSFLWTRNEFDEAWIEFQTRGNVYYFEMPYGFTRDPAAELCLACDRGAPNIVKSALPFVRGAKVSWWHHVEYDLGEVEPDWQVLLWVSNPFDTRCDVLIRPLAENEDVPRHLKKIRAMLIQKGRRQLVANQLLGFRYPKSPDLSMGSIESNFSRNPNDDRCWGHYELTIKDQAVSVVIPSSLFHYGHGVADPSRESEKIKSFYGPHSLDPRLPFYHGDNKDLDATVRVGGSFVFPFLLNALDDIHPKLKIETVYNGDKSALNELARGKNDIVFLTRKPMQKEIDRYVEKDGENPVLVPIAINRVGVLVHPDNPLSERGLTLAEAEAIFSTTRGLGHEADILEWGDLGLEGEWANEPINRYSGWESSPMADTLWLFRRHVMPNGEFKKFQLPEILGFTSGRENYNYGVGDKFGIGIGTVRRELDLFKAVPLGEPPILPTAGNCYRGDYPLVEHVLMVVSKRLYREENNQKLEAVREIIAFVLSRQGQSEMSSAFSCYLPLTFDLAKSSAVVIGVELPERQSHNDVPAAISGLLLKNNSPAEVQALILELSEPVSVDHNSSRQASQLIEQWRRSRNVSPLKEIVENYRDSRSAVSAAVALVSLGQTEYWKDLSDFSKNNHERMRSWVIHEIRQLNYAESIEILVELLGDETQTVLSPRATIADEALAAIRGLTDQDFGKDRAKWMRWWKSEGKDKFKDK